MWNQYSRSWDWKSPYRKSHFHARHQLFGNKKLNGFATFTEHLNLKGNWKCLVCSSLRLSTGDALRISFPNFSKFLKLEIKKEIMIQNTNHWSTRHLFTYNSRQKRKFVADDHGESARYHAKNYFFSSRKSTKTFLKNPFLSFPKCSVEA